MVGDLINVTQQMSGDIDDQVSYDHRSYERNLSNCAKGSVW